MGVYEDLKYLEEKLVSEGYSIDRFEVRERRNKSSGLKGGTAQRAVGRNPFRVLEDWGSIDGEDYVIEVFLSNPNNLDRVVYDPVSQEADYIGFSDIRSSVEELLEE